MISKLGQKTIERILNEAAANGFEKSQLCLLERELSTLMYLRSKTTEMIIYTMYDYKNKTLIITIDLDEIIKFNEVDWKYEELDRENSISKNTIDMKLNGSIYSRYGETIQIEFDSIHAKYLFDEKAPCSDSIDEQLIYLYDLENQCRIIETRLEEVVKKELFNTGLLEKAGIKTIFKFCNRYGDDGFCNFIIGKIEYVLINAYCSCFDEENLLIQMINIDETIKEQINCNMNDVFGRSSKIYYENLDKYVRERLMIEFSEMIEEALIESDYSELDFLLEILKRVLENYYKKKINIENQRLQ